MTALELIDLIAPKHTRTSCSDENPNGNHFGNEYGYPRCKRCALRFLVEEGIGPYGATVTVTDVVYNKWCQGEIEDAPVYPYIKPPVFT